MSDAQAERPIGKSSIWKSVSLLPILRGVVVIDFGAWPRRSRTANTGRNDIGASRGHIVDGVEASLRRLQTDHIYPYQIHGNDSVTPVEETIRALDTLVQQGKVRYIGCSNW